ncbi:hypothetical protein QBC46DRAFT_47216 [Diplogelasinospora grovesii]|uniref:Uncharacterized protein n=1 Tax=Diplogelasinospora grovesii TaxID=303347 RepID=A0AAN6MYY2_9PEZI|nr:hypothetical protein QBC46DRAFT_47216 [Diplogelasinospora grovesii]
MTDLRECLSPPIESHLSSPANERRISFRHPAYPDAAPDLLCLSAVDGGLGVGIEYNTALVAVALSLEIAGTELGLALGARPTTIPSSLSSNLPMASCVILFITSTSGPRRRSYTPSSRRSTTGDFHTMASHCRWRRPPFSDPSISSQASSAAPPTLATRYRFAIRPAASPATSKPAR